MDPTKSTSTNPNHNDDASSISSSSSSSRKRFKTFDNSSVGPWSDVNHNVLILVMMQLDFIDFFAFSGVCKSWRSLALSHKNWFMASRPPMSLDFRLFGNNDQEFKWYCYMDDFKGRRFETTLPHLIRRDCIGLTCGYLILFGKRTRDFWLVNPITKHQLHFPDHPSYVGASRETSRGILFFSPSISKWVFVLLHRKITFSIAGKQRWNHVLSTSPIVDLHVFKGKIYTLHTDCTLSELRLNLNQKRKYTLLKTNVLPNPESSGPRLVSSGENLFVINRYPSPPKKILVLDFGEMKWVAPGKEMEEYAFFFSVLNYSAAFKPESWVGRRMQHNSYDCFLDDDKSGKCMFYYERMWYFPHDCLSVNCLDE